MTLASLSAEFFEKVPEQALQVLLRRCERGIAGAARERRAPSLAARHRHARPVLAARRKGLADMLERWKPEQHPDVLALIDRMAQALTSDLPAPEAG